MNHDDVRSLRLLSRRITVALVVVAVVAMAFSAATVTAFAVDHGVSPRIAWVLDPVVCVALLVVLVADARLVELGVSPGGWPRVLRWFAGMATWAMNAWQSVWPDDGFGVPRQIDPAGVVLHSVAPVLLIVLAEAVTGYRRVIADRIRVLEGGAQCARPSAVEVVSGIPDVPDRRAEGGPQLGRPSLEVVVDDGHGSFEDALKVSGRPLEVAVDDHVRGAAEMLLVDDVRGADAVSLEDKVSSWVEPWRAPWDNHPIAGGFFPGPGESPVVEVVAGWSSQPARHDRRHDHLDDQAHGHPEILRDPAKLVMPVVADPVTSVAPAATRADHLDDQDAEMFADGRDDRTGSVTVSDATGGEGYGVVRTPAAKGQQMLLTPADDHGSTEAMSDAEMRRAARKLMRDAMRTTGRPATVDAFRDELGLSRRRAVELRREVLPTPARG